MVTSVILCYIRLSWVSDGFWVLSWFPRLKIMLVWVWIVWRRLLIDRSLMQIWKSEISSILWGTLCFLRYLRGKRFYGSVDQVRSFYSCSDGLLSAKVSEALHFWDGKTAWGSNLNNVWYGSSLHFTVLEETSQGSGFEIGLQYCVPSSDRWSIWEGDSHTGGYDLELCDLFLQ